MLAENVDPEHYGIYAFDSVDGLFERSYASGSPDSGFYIGQCRPCDAVIDDVMTTGASVGEAVRALTAAGSRPVAVATVAATRRLRRPSRRPQREP